MRLPLINKLLSFCSVSVCVPSFLSQRYNAFLLCSVHVNLVLLWSRTSLLWSKKRYVQGCKALFNLYTSAIPVFSLASIVCVVETKSPCIVLWVWSSSNLTIFDILFTWCKRAVCAIKRTTINIVCIPLTSD